MKPIRTTVLCLLFLSAPVCAGMAQNFPATSEIPPYKPVDRALQREISEMDSLFFDAYNRCDLKLQRTIYADSIEFFHDKGGLSASKADIISSTEKNICGKVTRKRVEGSLEVYPIKGYGAVEIGFHKFFNKLEPDAPSIPSKFIIMWKKNNDTWQITKVVSLH